MERPWIKHDGKGYPVPVGTAVEYIRENGQQARTTIVGHANAIGLFPNGTRSPWFWARGKAIDLFGWKVVAYRLASDPDAEAKRERYAAIFDDMIKTAPLAVPVWLPESEPA